MAPWFSSSRSPATVPRSGWARNQRRQRRLLYRRPALFDVSAGHTGAGFSYRQPEVNAGPDYRDDVHDGSPQIHHDHRASIAHLYHHLDVHIDQLVRLEYAQRARRPAELITQVIAAVHPQVTRSWCAGTLSRATKTAMRRLIWTEPCTRWDSNPHEREPTGS